MFWFFCITQKIKKESGENPERTGHCKWGVVSVNATD